MLGEIHTSRLVLTSEKADIGLILSRPETLLYLGKHLALAALGTAFFVAGDNKVVVAQRAYPRNTFIAADVYLKQQRLINVPFYKSVIERVQPVRNCIQIPSCGIVRTDKLNIISKPKTALT